MSSDQSSPGVPSVPTVVPSEQTWRVDRKTTTQQVIARLKQFIASGYFAPGDKLPPERKLVEMLGVSRPAVREALQALSALRLLNIRQGDGIYVSSLDTEMLLEPLHFVLTLDPTAVEEIFETRLVIESGVARLAATRMTDEAARRLDDLMSVMEARLGRPEAFHRADVEFHDAIAELVPNPFLAVCLKSLHELGEAARAIVCAVPGALEQAIDDHRALVDALKARDPESASRAARKHVERVLQVWQRAKTQGIQEEDMST